MAAHRSRDKNGSEVEGKEDTRDVVRMAYTAPFHVDYGPIIVR